MYITAIIPAAGMGSRMKSNKNKVYLKLKGKPILYYTLKNFVYSSFVEEVILVLKEREFTYCTENVLNLFDRKIEKIKMVKGGLTRKDSVYNGIKKVSDKTDHVIIHDGARPLITPEIINNIIGTLESEDAVTTGVNLKDTVKIKDNNNYVVKTINRNNLSIIQTPQAFSYKLIKEAHQKQLFDKNITDDAGLVEMLNHKVKIIEGSYDNIKVTTPIDITIAEEILESRRKGKWE